MSENSETPDPAEEIRRLGAELARQHKINRALMARVEREMNGQSTDFTLFQTDVVLESQVRERTCELQHALTVNEKITRALARAKEALEQEHGEQRKLIRQLEDTHQQLLQSEKMAAIGQLAAGVAHEINNPIGFVISNLRTLSSYVADLLNLIDLHESRQWPPHEGDDDLARNIRQFRERIDLEFLREDAIALIAESAKGADRVKCIVQDLREFSRPSEESWQWVDLRTGLDSTLNVMWSEIKQKADVVKEYGEIPRVECLAAQVNQIFMNLLLNAAQAIDGHGSITLRTGQADAGVFVAITDSGQGMPPEMLDRIFDPFFTTKPVGSGTGLGLSVSYGIARKHGGRIDVESELGRGSTFTLWLPLARPPAQGL